jgi:hypothetical protein
MNTGTFPLCVPLKSDKLKPTLKRTQNEGNSIRKNKTKTIKSKFKTQVQRMKNTLEFH